MTIIKSGSTTHPHSGQEKRPPAPTFDPEVGNKPEGANVNDWGTEEVNNPETAEVVGLACTRICEVDDPDCKLEGKNGGESLISQHFLQVTWVCANPGDSGHLDTPWHSRIPEWGLCIGWRHVGEEVEVPWKDDKLVKYSGKSKSAITDDFEDVLAYPLTVRATT